MALPMTTSSDVARTMPASPAARLDAATAAIASLRDEQRRLVRLGFELPLARCHEQLRYWSFVRALCALECAESR
jgi:hypothetical protein